MEQKKGFYQRYLKRFFDIVLSGGVMLVFCWVYAIVAVLVRIKLGAPVLFSQQRPGKIDPKTGKERIFKMYKFRSMTDARDENGELLPDEIRLTSFGKKLRATSLDELPELWNILKGDMSIVGPRPLLPKDVSCMDRFQHRRHTVRPGLTGLAQCCGRNSLNWDTKLATDVEYVEKLSLAMDVQIFFKTIFKVLKRENVEFDEGADIDLKDWNELKARKAKEDGPTDIHIGTE